MAFDIEVVCDDEVFEQGDFLARCGGCGALVGRADRKWLFYRMYYLCLKCYKELKK